MKPIINSATNSSLLQQCLNDTSVSDTCERWICTTCSTSTAKGKVPALAAMNGMSFPTKPPELDLHHLEERLISLRIPFMQLRELPRGKQYSVKGNVVNVPIDILSTVNALPRNINNEHTVPIRLKCKRGYKSVYLEENVRPLRVICALHCLLNNSQLWQEANVNIDED